MQDSARSQRPFRIALYQSSSTHLAIFFTIIILIASGLALWQLVVFEMGKPMQHGWLYLSFGLLLSTAFGLYVISFFVTKRINEIAHIADDIMRTGDISRRIPVYSAWDDLSTLSRILNHMLDEISTLVKGIRTVSDNIAHDLRHPLTRLRNHIETVRHHSASLSPEQISDHMSGLVHECDTLLNTFNALLRISNIESGKRHSGFKTINLSQVLHDVVELYEPVAHEKSITLLFNEVSITTVGDKDLLFQAFANLIDNAIKYTPEHGCVSISLVQKRASASITITDSGAGINDEHKANVFKRFYRVESSRSTVGSGLGLSLVKAIIRLHQGSIELKDNQTSGLIVSIEL